MSKRWYFISRMRLFNHQIFFGFAPGDKATDKTNECYAEKIRQAKRTQSKRIYLLGRRSEKHVRGDDNWIKTWIKYVDIFPSLKSSQQQRLVDFSVKDQIVRWHLLHTHHTHTHETNHLHTGTYTCSSYTCSNYTPSETCDYFSHLTVLSKICFPFSNFELDIVSNHGSGRSNTKYF